MSDLHKTRPSRTWLAVILAGLAMSVGWGFRGDYGHEAGAMVPGALLGLAICLGSGRQDWWRRATVMAFCGAVGWAFGGQMSYGRVIGYTASSSFANVLYGYASLFLIGALWAGIGSAILALSVTQSRSYLERFAGPLVVLWLVWLGLDLTGLTDRWSDQWHLHDTDWVAASSALVVALLYALARPGSWSACGLIATLAVGWWGGHLLLTVLLGLHMTPPRSDNWSGCVGLFVALLVYLMRRGDRAAVRMAAFGFLAGGIGFAVGDFVNMLGRAGWGAIGRYEGLQGLDYWKWMEQLFGLVMGLGVAIGFLGRLRTRLAPAEEDQSSGWLNTIAAVFLFVVMMWTNLAKNLRTWAQSDHIPETFFSLDTNWWFLAVSGLLAVVVLLAIVRHRGTALRFVPSASVGRAQLLFLLILWVAILGAFTQALPRVADRGVFFVHTTFWITGGLCSLLLLYLSVDPWWHPAAALGAEDAYWTVSLRYWLSSLLVPLLLLTLAYLTVSSHTDPLPGSHLRFTETVSQ
ncbi:MAG: hypothetical protein JSW27_10075 [Phycisphaerales bacterium]|nr:MAG: hypothetical protein JSW27_10075 [Phycisphaerales bacterium]